MTVNLQRQVVQEFLAQGVAKGYFNDIDTGLSFLRGAVGNFPASFDELAACANYVKYTAEMVQGTLKVIYLNNPNYLITQISILIIFTTIINLKITVFTPISLRITRATGYLTEPLESPEH